jgi:hypothetical protein
MGLMAMMISEMPSFVKRGFAAGLAASLMFDNNRAIGAIVGGAAGSGWGGVGFNLAGSVIGAGLGAVAGGGGVTTVGGAALGAYSGYSAAPNSFTGKMIGGTRGMVLGGAMGAAISNTPIAGIGGLAGAAAFHYLMPSSGPWLASGLSGIAGHIGGKTAGAAARKYFGASISSAGFGFGVGAVATALSSRSFREGPASIVTPVGAGIAMGFVNSLTVNAVMNSISPTEGYKGSRRGFKSLGTAAELAATRTYYSPYVAGGLFGGAVLSSIVSNAMQSPYKEYAEQAANGGMSPNHMNSGQMALGSYHAYSRLK